ncbi:MAG: hypothetical protein NC203_09915 [Firmicutes bacterium]|nr:hypothetical protein [[Eubacterium] siraeum]MCM1488667.1 hypothetical protein [Bacillota bacterium]
MAENFILQSGKDGIDMKKAALAISIVALSISVLNLAFALLCFFCKENILPKKYY